VVRGSFGLTQGLTDGDLALGVGGVALLVSHWPVSSEAAVALTTRMLTEYGKNPGAIGRAEALRRSMLALMMDHEEERFAHPFYWAPFVIVGEGGVPADRAISVQ
jgi:CHAT domain-containing protein